MNLAHNAQNMDNVWYLLKFFINKSSEIVDSLMLIISCLFPIGRVGTYRQVLHLLLNVEVKTN